MDIKNSIKNRRDARIRELLEKEQSSTLSNPSSRVVPSERILGNFHDHKTNVEHDHPSRQAEMEPILSGYGSKGIVVGMNILIWLIPENHPNVQPFFQD